MPPSNRNSEQENEFIVGSLPLGCCTYRVGQRKGSVLFWWGDVVNLQEMEGKLRVISKYNILAIAANWGAGGKWVHWWS